MPPARASLVPIKRAEVDAARKSARHALSPPRAGAVDDRGFVATAATLRCGRPAVVLSHSHKALNKSNFLNLQSASASVDEKPVINGWRTAQQKIARIVSPRSS